jgi:hypothetical protein
MKHQNQLGKCVSLFPFQVCSRGGPGPYPEAWIIYVGVRHSPMGSGLTDDALEYITFSGHVAAPELSMWWGRELLLA